MLEDVNIDGGRSNLAGISKDAGSAKQTSANQPSEEARTVIALEEAFWNTDQRAGTVCYVIPFDWWKRWCNYTGLKLEDKHTTTIQVCTATIFCAASL